MRTGFPLTLGGFAKVYCVHNREKRQVTDPEDVVKLGREIGVEFDRRKHKIHDCACCSNLFVTGDDTPTLCEVCLGIQVFELAAPLPEPKGVVG